MKYCVYVHAVKHVVVYVGAGKSATRPFEQTSRTELWRKHCAGASHAVAIHSWHRTMKAAMAAEGALIKALKPVCNIMHNPLGVKGSANAGARSVAIGIRVTKQQAARWLKAARADRRSMSAWVKAVCDDAIYAASAKVGK